MSGKTARARRQQQLEVRFPGTTRWVTLEQFANERRTEPGADALLRLCAGGNNLDVVEEVAAQLGLQIVSQAALDTRLRANGMTKYVNNGQGHAILRAAGMGEMRACGETFWVGDFAGLPDLAAQAFRLVRLRERYHGTGEGERDGLSAP